MRAKAALAVVLVIAAVAAWGYTVVGASRADQRAPTVTLVAPTTGTVVRGDMPLVARAHDAESSIDRVDFFVDGEWVAAATSAPWSVRWEEAADHPGERLVQAKATDAAGNARYSAEADITIADEEPPAVWIVDVDDRSAGSSVRVGATDNVAIERVEVFAGTTLVGVDLVRPYEVDVPAGELEGDVLKAKAVDTSGNVRYSAAF